MRQIDISKEFSDVPAGRFPSDGEFNGETFRKKFLVPALQGGNEVAVILDNTEGFGSSFLEEAFGGLVRREGFEKADLMRRLQIIATTKRAQRYKRLAEKFIAEAVSERG